MAGIANLGRYELRRILGRGAMGVVYEGFDPNLSRRVAVKTILKSVALDPETERAYSARFTQEAKAIARLNHPNIVQVYDFGVEGEVAYLVMEFIEGRELRSFFEAKELFNAAETVRLMVELLEALHFAHEAGVIHRDVKPANVMLDLQRRAKLTDFGVARIQESEHSTAGTMVGTPAFMSPEQIKGGKIDRRTDIFSAGVVLYRLLTGEQPFKGEGAWTVSKKIVEDDPPPPSSVVLTVSPAFDAVVHKALAKKPGERFASAREFATALRGVIATASQREVSVDTKKKVSTETKATETELEFWRSIQNRDDLEELELYIEQFPNGAYAQLARLKIAKLREPIEAARAAQEMRARQEAEARARSDAEGLAKREAEERARLQREADEKSRREAEFRAREADALLRRQAEERAQRAALEKAKRESEEKARQAQALARIKEQEQAAARAKALVDQDATVAIGSARPVVALPDAAEPRKSLVAPAVVAIVVTAGGIAAYFLLDRTSVPAPIIDVEEIRRETEDGVRKEFAAKAALEKAATEKAVAEKVAAEKASIEKLAQAKTAMEKAAAEKAMEKAAAERIAAEKAAREKADATKAGAEKLAKESAAAKVAAEKAAADMALAEKVAAEKLANEKAAAEKVAAEKGAAEKVAAEKAAAAKALADRKAVAEKTAAAPSVPRSGSQSWEYEEYYGSGKPSASGYITVTYIGERAVWREFAGRLVWCIDRERDATVTKTEALTTITILSDTQGCQDFRIVIRNDGTGGRREIRKGLDWVWDGLDRRLTPRK